MALELDLVEKLELEAGIVVLVVAGSTDLENHAGVALVTQCDDVSGPGPVGLDVVAAGAVAGFAADDGQVGMLGGPAIDGEATGLAKGRGMAAQAFGVLRLGGGLELLDRGRVGLLRPGRELLLVTFLAGLGAGVFGEAWAAGPAEACAAASRILRRSSRERSASWRFSSWETRGRKLA